MYSLSIDYLFNRVYDVLLWIKYVWVFGILRTDPKDYLSAHESADWDGLRDRGWFDDYFASLDPTVPRADIHTSIWQKLLDNFGSKLKDADKDGKPNILDKSPYDSSNLTNSQLKERYQADYTIGDKVRDFFGIGPEDSDEDGVPDSYENIHRMDANNPDGDRDGILDGKELAQGSDPFNNDSDGDGIIDGRDEAPLDSAVSSISLDTDGDGVSDKIEISLGTDINKTDTDGDGILDNLDTFPLDPNNIDKLSGINIPKVPDEIHLGIQNPVLSLFADFLSIVAIVFIVMMVYSAMMWFISFLKSRHHFEKHFKENEKNKDFHIIKDEGTLPAGIRNLPIHEEAPSLPPTISDFEDHPRFAIIQGYMSSTSEALWRIGIMEAENMLEEVLKGKGYQGQNVSELLKGASFKTVQLAFDAHNIRNRIAHQGSDFVLTEREAKHAFTLYESVFRELKAIH